MPEGFRIASAFVQVSPDTEGFKEELKAKLEEAMAGADAKARVGLDMTRLDADADKAKAKVDELGAKRAAPKVTLSDADASAKLNEIRARLDQLSARNPSPKIKADISDAEAKASQIEARIDRLNSIIARPKVTPQMADAQAKIDALQAKLEELGQKEATPKVAADIAAAQARLDELKEKLEELQAKDTQIRVKAGADLMRAQADLDRLLVKLEELDAKEARPKLGLDDTEFKAKLAKDKAELASAGGESGHGLLGAITAGIGALMPGIGGAATGMGLLAATGALAFGGIAKALSSAHQASQNVGMTSAQLAATQFQNAVAVQQAQQGLRQAQEQQAQDAVTSAASIQSAQTQVAQAYEQSAQDAITSAHSIESAQMNLASVERSAAESQIQALHSVETAQQGLEQANYGLSQAQYTLGQAWEKAREDLVSLNDQLADSRLNVQSAQLAIQQAIYQQKLIDQNAYSTQLDREQAALAVVRAQQQLKDAQDQETASQYAANLANRQGIEHSQTMIQAKQGVVQATYQQRDAQFAAADAQRQLALTEINNAQQVKAAQIQLAMAEEQAAYQRMRDSQAVQQAQRQLAQAQEQAAFTQMRDAENVAVAQRNVSNTIEEQRLQWAAMMSTENRAANQFAKDMARLTPAGRAFVEQVLGMSGAFRDLEAAAQNAVLPGFTSFLQGVQALMPTIESGIVKMGQAISSAFSEFGQLMATPEFATALDGLINNGVEFANIVLPAFAQFAQELAWIGSQQGATEGIANLLAGIAHALTGMAAGLGDSMPAINQFLTAAGNVIAQIGPPLGQILGLIARTLEPLTRYLNAHPDGTIAVVLGNIVTAMLLFKPLVSVVKAPFTALTSAVESISGLPAKVKAIVEKIVAAFGGLTGASSPVGAGAGAAAGAAGRTAAAGEARAAERALTGEAGAWASALQRTGGIFSGGSRYGIGSALASLGAPEVAALLGVAAIVSGIGYFADRVREASDRAKGVVETSSGAMVAASTIGTQHVSDGFRAMANNIADHAQSTATTVARSSTAVAGRFGDYQNNWSTHNDALVNVMQLGKDQLGQSFAQFASGMGGNVEQMGASLRQQGKTLNQAYNDAMNQVFMDLGGKTKESWAQAEQVMAQGLDKYYQSMRQTTTNDYSSLQQATSQLLNDYFHHRSDLEQQDWQKLLQVTQQYMNDSNNHLIDTSKSNISQLSQDVMKFFSDFTGATSGSVADDIKRLGDDTKQHFSDMADSVDQATSKRLDQEIASAQSDIARITQQQFNNLFPGHAEGGYISGPGTGTSDSVPAWLSNGEFVINAKATSAFRPLLEAINSNRFASGGFVDPAAPRLVNDQAAFAAQQALQQLQGYAAGVGAGVQGKFAGSVAQWISAAMAATGVSGADWFSGLEIIVGNESGGNPNAINLWDSNAAAGDPSRGLMQTIGSTFAEYHQRGTSWNIYDPIANIAAGIRYIQAVYGGIDNVPGVRSVRSGGAYLPYDSGGWLMPGDMPVNGLGKPEAVLTPQESEAFVQIVRQLTSQQGGSQGLGAKHATINFYGTQHPTAEQKAEMMRDLTLALGGAS